LRVGGRRAPLSPLRGLLSSLNILTHGLRPLRQAQGKLWAAFLRRFAAITLKLTGPAQGILVLPDSSNRLVRLQNLDRPDRGAESLARCAAACDRVRRRERWENPW